MKKITLKFIGSALASVMLVLTSTILNAQVTGGATTLTDPGGALTPDDPTVPLDPNMTLLFLASAVLFVTYKYKKGDLNFTGK